jgi:hypothetical protein
MPANSELMFKGPPGIPSRRNLTTMFAFFSELPFAQNI